MTRLIRAQDERLIMLVQAVDNAGRFDLAEIALHYLLATTDRGNPASFINRVAKSAQPETRKKIMNMAERLQKQARQEGVKQGIQKGVEKAGTEVDFIKYCKLALITKSKRTYLIGNSHAH